MGPLKKSVNIEHLKSIHGKYSSVSSCSSSHSVYPVSTSCVLATAPYGLSNGIPVEVLSVFELVLIQTIRLVQTVSIKK